MLDQLENLCSDILREGELSGAELKQLIELLKAGDFSNSSEAMKLQAVVQAAAHDCKVTKDEQGEILEAIRRFVESRKRCDRCGDPCDQGSDLCLQCQRNTTLWRRVLKDPEPWLAPGSSTYWHAKKKGDHLDERVNEWSENDYHNKKKWESQQITSEAYREQWFSRPENKRALRCREY